MKLYNYIWILPFLSFLFGTFTISYFFNSKKTINIPNLIGKSIIDAAKVLSENNLNIRIISEKEEADFEPGIIITQKPINQKVKQNQTIYVTISKKPEYFKMPDFRNQQIDDIKKILSKENIKPKIYYQENHLAANICISQYPHYNESIENKKVIIYLSSGNKKEIIFPNFKNQNLDKVINLLVLNDLKFKINTKNLNKIYEPKKQYIVADQRPFPGSIINLSPNLIVQLSVEEIK